MFLLNRVISNLVPNQILLLPPLVEIDDRKKVEVAAILDLYRKRSQIEYFI